jgi:hypothetical protein
VVIIGVMTLVLGFVVMALWNALVPELFHGPVLTFWQSIGLLLLTHILLRGWMPGRHLHGWRHDHWRKQLDAKLAAMSPEEREKFKAQRHYRCGPWGSDEPDAETAKQ